MKKYFIILLIILSIIFLKLVSTYLLNEKIIKDYNNNVYQKNMIKFLKITNINEPYIVYYNEGNIYYQEKNFDAAINDYEKALEKNPPLKRKCMIRINMSMALIQDIEKNNTKEKIELLEQAKQNLYEDHCADSKDSSGESQEAEELEEDIKKEQEKIKKVSNDKESNQEQEEEELETEEEKNIQNELKSINKDANANRQKDLQEYKNLGNYHYYSGKNW